MTEPPGRSDETGARKRRPRPAGPPPQHVARPPRDADPDSLEPWSFAPIGVVRSPWRYVHDAPRQGGVANTGAPSAAAAPSNVRAEIVLRKGMQNCLRDLAGFERVWVLFVFSYARGWKPTVVPPRDTVHRGVLATRAPHRPNPIGLTCARIVGVKGRTLTIEEHDLLDGTPVLDLKPYLPYTDAHPSARAGWTETVDPAAPDHRWK